MMTLEQKQELLTLDKEQLIEKCKLTRTQPWTEDTQYFYECRTRQELIHLLAGEFVK